MDKVEFDKRVAEYYVQKMQSAASRGLEFTLTLTQVKNMLRAKRCQLTGMVLVDNPRSPWRVTIDRIDHKKGYVTGNVAAVAWCVNNAKSVFENPNSAVNFSVLHRMSKELVKRGVK